MYCSRCGSFVEEGRDFCANCGTKVGIFNGYSRIDRINMRTAEVDELDHMIEYFGKKQDLYDEVTDCENKVDYYSNPNVVFKGFTGRPLKVIGLILTIVSCVLCYISAIVASMVKNIYLYIIVAVLALFIAAGVILIIAGVKKSNRFYLNSNFKKALIVKDNKLRIVELQAELYEHYENYGYCCIGFEYSNPLILNLIRNTIVSGQADSIKEALNILKQNERFSNLETLVSQTAVSAAEAAAAAERAAAYAAYRR